MTTMGIKSALISFIFFITLGFATLDPLAYGIDSNALLIVSFIVLMSVTITSVFLYTLRQTEKRILEKRYSFLWLMNLSIGLIFGFSAVAYLLLSAVIKFYFGGPGEAAGYFAAFFLVGAVISVPLGVLSAAIIPSIFFYKFYGDKKIFSFVSILFIVISFALGVYYSLDASTCDFNKNYICIAQRAIEKQDASLCERTKDFRKDFNERAYCYLELSRSGKWNDIGLCNKLSSDRGHFHCMVNIAITTNNPKICETIQNYGPDLNKEQCYSDLKWQHIYTGG